MISITVNEKCYNLTKNESLKIEDFDTELYVFNSITDNIIVLNSTSRFIFYLFYNEQRYRRFTVNELISEMKKEYIMTTDEEDSFEADLHSILETMIGEGVFCVQ